jgi:multiple sugar transport system permease protein
MLLPYLLGTVLLVIIPALLSFGLAFFHYDTLGPPEWAGLINFVLVYTDELFVLSVQNSLALILVPVPVRVVGALLLALLLRRGGRFLNFFRSLVFLPNIVPSTAYALAWLWILNPLYGPLNQVLRVVGLDPPAWLVDPVWAKAGLVLTLIWLVGEGFLVSLAALHDIPAELEDAARSDGATAFQSFRYVVLPLIAPILLLLTFRDAILLLQESFLVSYLLTDGGPYYSTFTLPHLVYEHSFALLSFGTASAALWVLYAITGLIVLLIYVIAHQWQFGTSEEPFVI